MSQRENVIGALFAVLGQLSLGTTVKRNAALPERIADHAMAILRDGEMGEPEVSLSPLTYHWQHQVAIELFVADPDASTRDARMDGLLTELASLIEADRTFAGVVEYAEIGHPVLNSADFHLHSSRTVHGNRFSGQDCLYLARRV